MSFISSIRAGGAYAPLDRQRSGDALTTPATGDDEGALPLPRHLLVDLAGIAAEVTALRQRVVDDPQLHDPLDRILGRLDDVVDSIYERAAAGDARLVDASSRHGSAITVDHPAAALAVRSGAVSTPTAGPSPTGVGRSIAGQTS